MNLDAARSDLARRLAARLRAELSALRAHFKDGLDELLRAADAAAAPGGWPMAHLAAAAKRLMMPVEDVAADWAHARDDLLRHAKDHAAGTWDPMRDPLVEEDGGYVEHPPGDDYAEAWGSPPANYGARPPARHAPPGWPVADLPLPLTVGDALDLVERDADALAAELAGWIEEAARALLPEDEAEAALELPDLAVGWPWPARTHRCAPGRPGRPAWWAWSALCQWEHKVWPPGGAGSETVGLWAAWTWAKRHGGAAGGPVLRGPAGVVGEDGAVRRVRRRRPPQQTTMPLPPPPRELPSGAELPGEALSLLHLAAHPWFLAWDNAETWAAPGALGPGSWHHAAARLAVEADALAGDALARQALEDPKAEALDRQAREVMDKARALRKAVEMEGRPPADPMAARKGRKIGDEVALWWDALAADFLERLGAEGAATAEALRLAAAERWAGPPLRAWSWWIRPADGAPGVPDVPRFAAALARALWRDVVRPRCEAERLEREAPRFALVTVEARGDAWAKVDKGLGTLSWAFGGAAVTVDGDRYARAPGEAPAALYLPRTWDLLPHGAGPASQAVLPFAAPPEPVTLAIANLTADRRLLSPLAGKMALIVLSAGDRMAVAPVRDMTRLLQPGKRRYQLRDDEATVRALNEIAGLYVYLPGHTTPRMRAFDVLEHLTPEHVTAETLVGACRGRFFQALMAGVAQHSVLRGEFLVNLTRALALDNERPALLRLYLRAAAAWNEARNRISGRYEAGRLEAVDLDTLAARCNALTPGAVEYLKTGRRGQGYHQSRTSRDRKAVRDNLDSLEADGLIVLDRADRNRLRLLPPEGLHEAWEGFRAGANTRPGRKPRKG